MPARSPRPLLVFDGDCSFCRLWVGYWNKLTGDAVDYQPFQKVAPRFPEVPPEDFRRSVQFFLEDRRYSGAEAVFHLLALVPGLACLLWLFSNVPGLAPLSEFVYRRIASHRNAGYKITRALWGRHVEPPSYTLASSLFSRAVAFIYLIAFVSFGQQVRGLIGAKGLQPVAETLAALTRQIGPAAIWRVPTLFWWAHSEFALLSLVWGGAVLAFVAAIARPHTAGQKAAFIVLFVYYLSVVNGAQVFMSYQWDYLLLEAGFLAIFLKPSWPRVLLFRWLLFRLMFQSGVVKLASGDLTWHNLTALSFHYMTQPLPTPLAWYAAQLPLWFQQLSTLMVFVIELILPFFIFGPRRCKQLAAAGFVFLETLILLTGNYTFFNLLTIALCLFLLDDALLSRWFGPREPKSGAPARRLWRERREPKPLRANSLVSAVLVTIIVAISLPMVASSFGVETPPAVHEALSWPATWGIVNGYGLFANMTTTRPEISLEGSNDNVAWTPYVFRYKAGPLERPPSWVAPAQPRLDWQMWFAALGSYRENPWLIRLISRLLEGEPRVLELLGVNPFPGGPPKYVRAMIYQYTFTTYDERRRTGNWWKRQLLGEYFPPASLQGKQ